MTAHNSNEAIYPRIQKKKWRGLFENICPFIYDNSRELIGREQL